MRKKGRSPEEIAELIDFDVETVKKWLQIAAYYGRFCGAKRPQCEAERPGFLLI